MKLTRKNISLSFLVLLVGVTLILIAIPGPQRLMFPKFYGWEEFAPNVFAPPLMDTTSRRRALTDIQRSEEQLTHFYGVLAPRPIFVLCPKTSCNDTFGSHGARGIAYGKRVVRLNDMGINQVIITHELSHINLKSKLGEWRGFFGAVPAWFDEGLAVSLSKYERYDEMQIPEDVLSDLKARDSWRQWGAVIKTHGWQQVYGGAKVLFEGLQEEIGDDGIKRIVHMIAKEGMDFNEALCNASAPYGQIEHSANGMDWLLT